MKIQPNTPVPVEFFDAAATDPHLEGYINPSRSQALVQGSQVVGFVAPKQSKDGVWRLKTIYVHPPFRGKGYGVAAIQAFYRDQKPGRAFIHTSNKASQAAYRRAGFEPYEEESRWGGGSWWANPSGLRLMGKPSIQRVASVWRQSRQ